MSGFYKVDEVSGELLRGPNFVHAPDFSLLAEDKDEYLALDIFPMDGWYWFDTEEEAREFLGVPAADPEPDTVWLPGLTPPPPPFFPPPQ